jgi:dTDP-4-amino-4,6-dideoxygalactose transaminase
MSDTVSIPLNSLARHFSPLQEMLGKVAQSVISSGHYVLGPNVGAFEKSFAEYCGVNHCVSVANGTDALEIALKAVGVGSGDRVAGAANAAMYGTSAILACNARPVYVDVAESDSLMDSACLHEALDAQPGIKAVIITHLYGRLTDMQAIVPIARERGVLVIEDCAQAHGARDGEGRLAGSFGDAASFSFYPTKNLGALGDGGAVLSNDAHICERAAQLRQYGWSRKYINSIQGGRNSRLDEIQAAMLTAMLPMLDSWNLTRREIANRYSRTIHNPRIITASPGDHGYVAHLYVVRCDDREALRSHLSAHGVQTDVHYPVPDHRQPCHRGLFDAVHLPTTEKLAHSTLTLPCFPELVEAEIARVVDACNSF